VAILLSTIKGQIDEKIAIVRGIEVVILPALKDGRLKPVISRS